MGSQQQETKALPSQTASLIAGAIPTVHPGEFSILAHDGKTWGIYSTSVKLDMHIGHTVTVTGSRTHESKAQMKAEENKEVVKRASSKEEYANLGVTSLKMVSDTCSN